MFLYKFPVLVGNETGCTALEVVNKTFRTPKPDSHHKVRNKLKSYFKQK